MQDDQETLSYILTCCFSIVSTCIYVVYVVLYKLPVWYKAIIGFCCCMFIHAQHGIVKQSVLSMPGLLLVSGNISNLNFFFIFQKILNPQTSTEKGASMLNQRQATNRERFSSRCVELNPSAASQNASETAPTHKST